MSKIQALREFIFSCPLISTLLEDIHVDTTEENPVNYGIMPTGELILKKYITGGCQKQYDAVFYIRDCTIDDYERIENSEFLEEFTDWIETQNNNENLPKIDNIESISCSNGMLFDLSEDGTTGLYQLQLQIIYRKD